MNKHEFLGHLERLLKSLPRQERQNGCRIKNGLVKKRDLQTMVQCHRE